MPARQCLNCGMAASSPSLELDAVPPRLQCTKCDENLYAQHDGSTLTRDIAHSRETIAQALRKLDEALLGAWQGYCRDLRLIVGGGLIREQVLGQLHFYQAQGKLVSYREESPNRGAIVATIRRS